MPRNSTIQTFILVLFFVIGGNISAQLPISGNLLKNTGTINSDTFSSDTTKKTVKPKKFRWYPSVISSSDAWFQSDTFLKADTTLGMIQRYTRESRSVQPYANLGISGTPSAPLFLQEFKMSGIQLGGLNVFEPYAVDPKNFKFYRVSQPFSEFKYSQGDNGYIGLEALHTQNLSKTWNVAIDYHTITNGEVYVGSGQDNLIRNLGIGSNFISQNGKFHQQLIFTWNRIRRLENGGLSSDSVFYGPTGFQGSDWNLRTFGYYDPRISNAKSYNSYSNHQINHRYAINSTKNIHLESQINWVQHKYDFEDAFTDTTYYGSTSNHRLVGSNDSSQWHRWEIKTGISKTWQSTNIQNTDVKSPAQQRIYFNHILQIADYQQFSVEKDSAHRNRFYYTQSHGINLGWNRQFKNGWFTSNDANYYFSGYAKNSYDISSNLKKRWNSKFFNSNLLIKYQPIELINLNFLSNHLDYLNSSSVNQKITSTFQWKNTFGLQINNQKLHVIYTFGSLQNPIFFYNQPKPLQLNHIQYQQLQLQWIGHFKHWYLHASTFAQTNSFQAKDSSLRLNNLGLPSLHANFGFAYQNTLFKKAISYRIGADIQYTSSYNQLQYRIDAAQYYMGSNSRILGNYPIADIYLITRIQTIDIFFKYEHLNEWIVSPVFNKRYESTYQYPIQPARFRFGFTWKFWN